MFPLVIPNSTSCVSEEGSNSSAPRLQDFGTLNSMLQNSIPTQEPHKTKKKRNLPGNPDPDAEVIALSPKTLLATNRFVCEICNKGFQRDQNLQLHRRGHNLPWKLKQRNSKENRKRAYVCPEPTCLHHHPSRALGDLTGIKKHYCRKHGEKKWKCEKCSKIYAVQSDWKAHSKTCGTREYRCDCGTLFSRKDSFITHRAFCDALAEESARLSAANPNNLTQPSFQFMNSSSIPPPAATHLPAFSAANRNLWDPPVPQNPINDPHAEEQTQIHIKSEETLIHNINNPSPLSNMISTSRPLYVQDHIRMTSAFGALSSPPLSATALLQKAATMGAAVGNGSTSMSQLDMQQQVGNWQKNMNDGILTRDFLGLNGGDPRGANVRELLPFTTGGGGGGLKFPSAYDPPDHHSSLFNHHGFGFTAHTSCSPWSNS